MYDAKDIEIARLKGQVEALERILAATRAALPSVPAPPQVWPTTVPPYPIGPTLPPQPTILPIKPDAPWWQTSVHGGMCACPQCCPPIYCGTTMTVGLFAPGTSSISSH